MLGDDESVVNISMTLHGKFHERHAALYFNNFREAADAKIASYHHINSEENSAGMSRKHWKHWTHRTHFKTWPMLNPLFL